MSGAPGFLVGRRVTSVTGLATRPPRCLGPRHSSWSWAKPRSLVAGKARLRVAGAGPSLERGEGSGRVGIPASCRFIFTSRRWGLLQWPPPSRAASGTLYQVPWRARCRSSCREDPARGTMAPCGQAEPEDTASRGWLHGVTRLEGQLP